MSPVALGVSRCNVSSSCPRGGHAALDDEELEAEDDEDDEDDELDDDEPGSGTGAGLPGPVG